MKFKLMLLGCLLLVLFGCSSKPVQKTTEYVLPITNIIRIYEINLMLKDSTLSSFQIFSVWQPNGFWWVDSTGTTQIVYYIKDVTGREFYLPSEVIQAIKVTLYSVSGDEYIYKLKSEEMLRYYLDMR